MVKMPVSSCGYVIRLISLYGYHLTNYETSFVALTDRLPLLFIKAHVTMTHYKGE